ncbi:MAG: azurin [Pseudomonadota bacterium]
MRQVALFVLFLSLSGLANAQCAARIEVGDALKYSITDIAVDGECQDFSIELVHTGSLPSIAMGHNWVLSTMDDVDPIAQAGIQAGAENNYLSKDDGRVIAATKLIGGGEQDKITFSLTNLEKGKQYAFFCSFPGHTSMMRGTFVVG